MIIIVFIFLDSIDQASIMEHYESEVDLTAIEWYDVSESDHCGFHSSVSLSCHSTQLR